MQRRFSDYSAGAGLATDLVNTSALVRGAGEALADPAALERFLGDHDIRPGGPLAAGDLDQVHVLRDEIRAVLESATDDEVAAGANALLARAGVVPSLSRDAQGRWQWYAATPTGAAVADEVAAAVGVGLLGALHTLGHDRFRQCASPDCNGVFVDTSRAGRRRYCMPDLCGNRLNVANHRARRRTGQGEST